MDSESQLSRVAFASYHFAPAIYEQPFYRSLDGSLLNV